MRNKVLLMLLLAVNLSFAQGIGYLGKRNTITYKSGFALNPILKQSLFENNYWSKYRTDYWSFTPELEINRSIKYNTAFGVGVSLLNHVIYADNSAYAGSKFLPSNVYGASIKVSYSWFSFKNSGAIAPLGTYKKLFLFAGSASVVDVNNFLYGNYNPIGFGAAIGKNYIFFDQFILNYEFEMNVPLSGFGSLASGVTETIKSDCTRIDLLSNFLKFNIGIGYVFNDKFQFKR